MLQNDLNTDIIISFDETQMNHIGNAPRSANKPNAHSFDVAAHPYTINVKKKKRHRTAFTTDQLLVLEKTFSVNKYIDRQKRKKLADNLMISEKSVKVWFQNRRMKNKRLSESSSDSSSDVNDPTRHAKINQNNEDYQLPLPPGELPTVYTDHVNFYSQCNQHQFEYTDYYQQPTHYHQYNYQYNGVSYNHLEYSQAWPQHYTNFCLK